jgi:hypothetical protein
MKPILGIFVTGVLLLGGAGASGQNRRQTTKGRICGDPTVQCRTSTDFETWDLPFEVPKNGVIWESEFFYAVILKSVRSNDDCTAFVPETERLAAQAVFPKNKVFASRCAEAGNIYYSNTAQDQQFMGVFAGRSKAEANAVLAKVKAAGGFPGANVRRMRTGFNGT